MAARGSSQRSLEEGISTKQLSRMLKVTCKTACFLPHRMNEAAVSVEAGEIDGANKVVEADQAYVGGRKKAYHYL
ncbi:hypothetical protein H8A99_30425 [Bradyrhizobium sp. Arg68]|uniref:hypothetical protein n=1 Tax=Bradyrhizobium ivorense TaxID=2511166 RepID=UPI001E5C7406|nr:hypothetical protein [Bradyrhizobium ivorense]MCC8940643.1 hypothetical protein [Bradyrhizobium ivorense]